MGKQKEDAAILFYKKIAEKIKKIRIFRNITQEELAKYIGVQQHVVYAYERGKYNISFFNILKICEFFKIPPSYLLTTDPLDDELYKISQDIDLDSYFILSEIMPEHRPHFRYPICNQTLDLLNGIYLGKNEIIINYVHKIIKSIAVETNYNKLETIEKLKNFDLKYERYEKIVDYYSPYRNFIEEFCKDKNPKLEKYHNILFYVARKADIIDREHIVLQANRNKKELEKDIQELFSGIDKKLVDKTKE